MKVIDFNRFKRKKQREKRRYRQYYQTSRSFWTRALATILVGYLLNYFVPIWLSVLMALTIVSYVPSSFYKYNSR